MIDKKWKDLIRYTKIKIERSKVKTLQLEALLVSFRAQARAGAPCPTDVDAFRLPSTLDSRNSLKRDSSHGEVEKDG